MGGAYVGDKGGATEFKDYGDFDGWRRHGKYDVPSKQTILNAAMKGQIMYCPNCGECHAVPMDQRVECKCGGLFTFSMGRGPDGNVVIVRIERWR